MKKSKNNIKSVLLGILFLPVLLGLFFTILRFFSPTTIKFPTVFEIYGDFIFSLFDLGVLKAVLSTAKYVVISLVLSIILGTLVSFVLNLNKKIWSAVEPTIDFFRSVPITFFIPAFAVIIGVSSPNIIWILAVIPSTLIIVVNVAYGIKELEKPDKQNRLHHYQLLSGKKGKWESFRKVKIYEILPHFMSGFKVALSYAIVIVTVLEYMQMGNEIGLGRLVYEEMEQLRYERVYSIIIIVGLIGYILNLAIDKFLNDRYGR
jgi:ABC-type nitrate/sulfonate/bicarbonate transport system permease component